MTLEAKNRILNNLQLLKSFGYEYHENIDLHERSKEMTFLPDDLNELKKIALNCNLCELCKSRKNVVFGEGSANADVMFVGEAPGATEDETGKPFVGRAGELLTKMIERVLFVKREDVYIANIVKCRPPGNRVPTLHEANSCKGFIKKQLELIKPKIIVALGRTSYQYLSEDENTPISKIRGKMIDYKGTKLIPTYHPSYLLRNPSAKKEAYEDMLKVKSIMDARND